MKKNKFSWWGMLSILLVFGIALIGCDNGTTSSPSPRTLRPGTYSATVPGNNGPVTVEVTVTGDAIAAINIGDNVETHHIMAAAGTIIPNAIIENQSLAVDVVSGATITSYAILNAVTDCIELAGGDIAAWSVKEDVKAGAETLNCDVIVVGAGLSGLSAANRLLSAGIDVVVIEQLAITGGTTRFAGGSMFGSLNRNVAQQDVWTAYGYTGTPSHAKTEDMLKPATMNTTFDFYRSLGFILGHESPTELWRVTVFDESISHREGTSDDEGGYIWSKSLENAFVNRGGKLLLNTKVVGIRTDGNGNVVGIDAETKTGALTINAKYTIMATGGIGGAASKEVLEYYFPTRGEGEVTLASVGATGEGLLRMIDLGAIPYSNSQTMANACYYPLYARGYRFGGHNAYQQSNLTNASTVYVDYEGVRRTTESGNSAATVYTYTDKTDGFFAIFDTPLAESLLFTQTLQKGLSEFSTFYKADTLEQLAAQTGFNTATFLATIEEYNGFCDTGDDAAFHKSASSLNAIKTGPFYAVWHGFVALDLMGGVETSNSFQVLKTNGTIPNLYAVGSTTVADFPGHAGGANLACGGYSARIAADHIIELLK